MMILKKVRVYWNLHSKIWSVQDSKSGLVIDHVSHISTCGLLISIDTLILMSGVIPTIVYTSSLIFLLGAIYLLVKENK